MKTIFVLSRMLKQRFNSKHSRDFSKMRNVEIKTKVRDLEEIKTRAKDLSKSEGVLNKQHDTFFKVSKGRLKLREFEKGPGTLIYYERPDTEGPKLSDYVKTLISRDEVQGVIDVLDKSNGIIGVVEKVRFLYMVGQTRIHIDSVKNLGDFMELEVVLNEEQTLEDGQKIAKDLMSKLDVREDDLLAGAYFDMLLSADKNQNGQ